MHEPSQQTERIRNLYELARRYELEMGHLVKLARDMLEQSEDLDRRERLMGVRS